MKRLLSGGCRGLGMKFEQDSNLRAGMNVVADQSIAGDFVRRQSGRCDVFPELGDFAFDDFADGGALVVRELLFVERFVLLKLARSASVTSSGRTNFGLVSAICLAMPPASV